MLGRVQPSWLFLYKIFRNEIFLKIILKQAKVIKIKWLETARFFIKKEQYVLNTTDHNGTRPEIRLFLDSVRRNRSGFCWACEISLLIQLQENRWRQSLQRDYGSRLCHHLYWWPEWKRSYYPARNCSRNWRYNMRSGQPLLFGVSPLEPPTNLIDQSFLSYFFSEWLYTT